MKVSFPRSFRAIALLVGGLMLPFFFTQCKSTGGNYKQIEYDPSTLKTPSGHGMEKKEYPFDDDGKYRKDWVRNKSTGKTRSASKLPEQTVASTDSTTAISASSGSSAGYYGPADVGAVAMNDTTTVAPPVTTTPVAATPSATYHKVVSGDTLYSLSQRFGTSVDELKRVNGLTSNNIRVGQSLRLP